LFAPATAVAEAVAIAVAVDLLLLDKPVSLVKIAEMAAVMTAIN
jgi:hypothetical protein